MLPDSHLTCALVCSSLFRVSLMGARTRPTGPCRPGSSRPTGKKHLRGSSSRPSGKMHLRGSHNLRCYIFRTRPTGPSRPGSSRPWLSHHLCTCLFFFCLEFLKWEPVHGQPVHVGLALVDPQGRCIWGEVLTSVVIVSVHSQQARVDLALVDPQGRCICGLLEVLPSVDIVSSCRTYTPDGSVYTHSLAESHGESICAVTFPYRHQSSTGD